jgi:radical S-adenosyl methionine domain-containing protein 2
VAAVTVFCLLYDKLVSSHGTKPVSVNYHFTRKCSKTCLFCFHTGKMSFVAAEADMQRGLRLLRDAAMRKINFAEGELFLYPKKLAMLCRFSQGD